jgi:chondroitin 4-sulfotransferase 11
MKIPKSIRDYIYTNVPNVAKYPYSHYSYQYKCIFIHIPKNAGTSILYLLNNNTHIDRDHHKYLDYQRSDPNRFNEYHKFCIIRNPWDRLLSAYHYLAHGGNKTSDINLCESLNNNCEDFEEFILKWLDFEKIYNITILNPQHLYIYDYTQKKIVMDSVLRFEYLDYDFSILQNKLSIPGELPKKNITAHNEYKSYYNNKMIKKVTDLFLKDIILFNYKF